MLGKKDAVQMVWASLYRHISVLNVIGRDTASCDWQDATALKKGLEHKSITIVWQMKSITNLDF